MIRHIRTQSPKLATIRSLCSATPTIGFIGLGMMGSKMAGHLQHKFGNLKVFDVVESNIVELESQGATRVATVEELAASCSTIITMLPATQHVNDVLTGTASTAGVFRSAQKGSLIIDCSTIDPVASQALHEQAANYNLDMIDAPVSGGVAGATAGTLTFMVGGSTGALQSAEAMLLAMGKNIVHCGAGGTGEIAKVCNNLALGISMVGTAEAMNLGVRLNLDPKVLASIMNTSTGRCWSSEVNNPCPGVLPNVPASRDYEGGFAAALMAKDLSLALDAASAVAPDHDAASILPLGVGVHGVYEALKEQGMGGQDFSVVYKALARQQGFPQKK